MPRGRAIGQCAVCARVSGELVHAFLQTVHLASLALNILAERVALFLQQRVCRLERFRPHFSFELYAFEFAC